jgi:hypothetical protein
MAKKGSPTPRDICAAGGLPAAVRLHHEERASRI